jgi:hypothetical protein
MLLLEWSQVVATGYFIFCLSFLNVGLGCMFAVGGTILLEQLAEFNGFGQNSTRCNKRAASKAPIQLHRLSSGILYNASCTKWVHLCKPWRFLMSSIVVFDALTLG